MRISKENLAPDIKDTLSKIENVFTDYKNVDKVANVGYDGKNFVIKRTGSKENIITSKEELLEFEKHLYDNDEIYESSFNVEYVVGDNLKQTQLFYGPLNTRTLISANEKIKMIKDDKTSFLILTSDGKLVVFSKSTNKPTYACEIIKDIIETFNIRTFTIYDIIDIELSENAIFIATDLYGIFQIDLKSKSIELKFKELNTTKLKYIGDGSLLCLTKNYIALYNVEYQERIERYTILKNNYQVPKDIFVNDDNIFILSKSLSGTTNDRILYHFKKSGPTLIHNMSHKIPDNKSDLRYNVKFISGEKNLIYLVGTYENHLFTWIYDINKNEYEERIFDIKINDLEFFNVEKGIFIFGYKNRVLFSTNDGVLLGNKYCETNLKAVFVSDSSSYLVSEKTISTFGLNYSPEKKTKLLLIDGDKSYNDVSLLILRFSKTDGIKVFVDDQVTKDFSYAYTDKGLYIKFNCKISKLEIEISPESIIPGLILKKNEVYV